jgi:hypothetical protein
MKKRITRTIITIPVTTAEEDPPSLFPEGLLITVAMCTSFQFIYYIQAKVTECGFHEIFKRQKPLEYLFGLAAMLLFQMLFAVVFIFCFITALRAFQVCGCHTCRPI